MAVAQEGYLVEDELVRLLLQGFVDGLSAEAADDLVDEVLDLVLLEPVVVGDLHSLDQLVRPQPLELCP